MNHRALAALLAALAGAAALAWAGPGPITVTDGDTIRLGEERIRLMGYDAPELSDPACERERLWAEQATRLLGGLIALGEVTIERAGADRYGRTLAVVRIDGTDVAALMIAAGLGREYHGGRREGWC